MVAITFFRLLGFGLFIDIMLSIASRRAFTIQSLFSRRGYSAVCLIPLLEISILNLKDKTHDRTLVLSILLGFYTVVTGLILLFGFRSLHRVSRLQVRGLSTDIAHWQKTIYLFSIFLPFFLLVLEFAHLCPYLNFYHRERGDGQTGTYSIDYQRAMVLDREIFFFAAYAFATRRF